MRVLAEWGEGYAGRCFPLEIGTCDRMNKCIIGQEGKGGLQVKGGVKKGNE